MTLALNPMRVPTHLPDRRKTPVGFSRVRFAFALAIAVLFVLSIFCFPSQRVSVAAADGIDERTSEVEKYCAAKFSSADPAEDHSVPDFGDDLAPIRCLSDPYPSFNSVAVDPKNDLVVMGDVNRKSLLVYDRRDGGASREATVPQRQIMGPKTQVGFVAGVAFDPDSREIFAVNNDIEDTMMVFAYDDNGNISPKRLLAVPHQSWGLAVSRSLDQIALTVESLDAVVFYRRTADRVESPTRSILGIHTGLADPHGIAFDEKNRELIVTNHGNLAEGDVSIGETRATTGGRFEPPSIRVFDYTSKGDVPPIRTIAGDRTLLDWPMGVIVDVVNDELVVANNGQNSVLVFERTATGNVAPKRIIRGPKTGINLPMGVAVDNVHNEIWVANFGDHNALVFDLKAKGNVEPKRMVRNAPAGSPTVGFGNPMAAAYDTKRHEILVPN